MKKLLLSALILTGMSISSSAQNFYLIFQGEKVENGATIVYDSIVDETWPEIPNFVQWTLNPGLDVVSTVDANLTINAKSNLDIQLCTWLDPDDPSTGTCAPGTDVTKTPVQMTANVEREVDLHVITSTTTDVYQVPEYKVVITITSDAEPGEEYVVNLTMGGFTATAGVESLTASQNAVNYNGREIVYDLPGACELSVYSLSGKTVLSKAVAGAGSVNLEGLSKGIYLYRVSGKYTKAGKIIIK